MEIMQSPRKSGCGSSCFDLAAVLTDYRSRTLLDLHVRYKDKEVL